VGFHNDEIQGLQSVGEVVHGFYSLIRFHGRGVQPVQAYFFPDKNFKAQVQNSPQGVAVQNLFHIRLVGIDVAYGNIRLL